MASTVENISRATIRFAGDSGDGMQLTGTQLTNTSALAGNDVATFPDFPAEIRAPRGTRAGVSGFQVQFASEDIFTPGDQLDTLVVMNPAALVTNISDLRSGGLLIVNEDNFVDKEFRLAKLESNPLDDPDLDQYRLIKIKMTLLTRTAVEELELSTKIADRCKNFFAMGFVYWLYNRDLQPTLDFINAKFGGKPEIAAANEKALRAGYNYGETTEAAISTYQVEKAKLEPGRYKNIMGNQALAWGCIAAAKLSNKDLFLGSYPITPASDILHELSKHKKFGVRTFQAEDEIAAVCATIGAAFGGHMSITTSSGPGIALKGEAMGLGMILELPMLIINIQRGGPSTGLPTKTEQSDLLQVMYGRNGESPLPVIAARSPADCFETAIEAWRVAAKFMCPVMVLSDGYIANGAEPWRIPDFNALEKIEIVHPGERSEEDPPFLPYKRDEFLSRPWALPGTKGLEHRIGGLEKDHETGNVSYDPENHEFMCKIRQEKIDRIADFIPELEVDGEESGDLLVLSWGGTYGACTTAVAQCQAEGLSVSHAHLRFINPFPRNLETLLGNFKKVVIPELNLGQLQKIVSSTYGVQTEGIHKLKGRPFTVSELKEQFKELIG
ncbi:MAG: 2-oxoglutarate ferredoxin oxidoreductase subunit alpha [Rhodopirellula sp.]|nr:2-oxoglutarate ferredoxin oxidoreductase subunit alpha [Rhodopirellula sp.]HCA50409.1 2-oxoglutarate ferredoxin oxidoreductase subunit alpha [Planctomycetaceae bacterium]|tara:strand:- start:7599 stop:9437 length:1839 start_codon:yes stop_codon:yes gene_type:complete